MENYSDLKDLRDVDFAEIERNARKLRAEAVRDGFLALKQALASIHFGNFGKNAQA